LIPPPPFSFCPPPARDPRWGRNQEVPGEDPLLNGYFGQLYTQGIQQGADPNYVQVVVVLKHWDA
jgi:beta-glucosidase-like glycosyl hydrolase